MKISITCISLILCAVIMQQVSAGVIYTRWGRKSCRAGAQVLYSGYMAGSHYTHTGGGSNLLCVHGTPEWGSGNVPGEQPWSSYIYGVEYEVFSAGGYNNNKPFSYANSGGVEIGHNDAVCASCFVTKASASVMVPGRTTCPSSDMHLEYSGYIMSSTSSHHSNEYVCIDSAPDVRPGGQARETGSLLYITQIQCGSLPCNPYTNFNELSCVVCSI